MNTQLLQQAKVLSIDEQIELVEAIWDGIVTFGQDQRQQNHRWVVLAGEIPQQLG